MSRINIPLDAITSRLKYVFLLPAELWLLSAC